MLTLQDEAGRLGLGEASPLPGYSTETLEQCETALIKTLARSFCLSESPAEALATLSELPEFRELPSVQCCLEIAYLDLLAQRAETAHFSARSSLWGALLSPSNSVPLAVAVAALLENESVGACLSSAERAFATGVTTFKLKLGIDFELELAQLAALRTAFGSRVKIRVDANQSFRSPLAEMFAALEPFGPEFIEEPSSPLLLAETLTSASIEDGLRIPIALDESLRTLDETKVGAWLRDNKIQVLVLKPMSLGLWRCIRWAQLAEACGAKCVVSHLFSGPIATAWEQRLARSLGSRDLAQGLHYQPAPLDLSFSLEALARLKPAELALIDAHGALSYAALRKEAARTLTLLLSLGLNLEAAVPVPVAFVARIDRPTWILIALLLDRGVPFVPLHPRWRDTEQSAALAGKPRHLLLPAAWAEAVPERASRVADKLLSGALDIVNGGLSSASEGLPEDRLAAVVFTSGTSGTPKGVCLNRSALLVSAQVSAENLEWQQTDRWLLNLPLSHIGGISVLTRCLLAQKPCVLANPEEYRDPGALLDWIAASQSTLLSWVPTQLARMLREPDLALPACVRAILIGGAPLAAHLEHAAALRSWPILATYGLTEAASQVATRTLGVAAPEGSVGKPLGHLELRTTAGVIELRGPGLFGGYWGEKPRNPDAWFPTADLGSLDSEGYLTVLGRADDVVISGGENVHPVEVEAVIGTFPGVDAVCVFGIPDPDLGEALACAVTPAAQNLSGLLEHIFASLAGFKRPRWIATLDELPVGQSGKLERRRLAVELATSLRPFTRSCD